MSSTLLGKFLKSHITIFSQLAGILILIFGILIILEKGFKGIEIKNSNPKTYLGAFLFGSAFGVSWTPCVGPILVAILLMASTTNSIITGGLLLFIYGIGLALPLILFSLYVDKLNKKNKVWRILKGCDIIFIFDKKEFNIHSNSLISGVLFILMGYLIFSGNLYSFNQYISASALQNWTIGIENWILSILN
jgi:cytochrome c-type biogenesis protein